MSFEEYSPITSLTFVRGVYAIVGGIPELVRRSYKFDLTSSVIRDLQDTVDPLDGSNGGNALNIAASALRYDENNIPTIALPGSSKSRLVVYMVFRDTNTINNTTIEYTINGYTDEPELTMNNRGEMVIAPDCMLYINQIIKTVSGYNVDHLGNRRPFTNVEECDVVFTGIYNIRDLVNNTDYSIRPMDIFSQRQLDVTNDIYQSYVTDNSYNQPIINNLTMFTGSGKHKLTRRSNTDGFSYVKNIMRSFESATAMCGDSQLEVRDGGASDYYSTGRNKAKENTLKTQGVLQKITQISRLDLDGCVSFKDLSSTWPEIYNGALFVNATSDGDNEFKCDPTIFMQRHAEVSVGLRLVQSISAAAMYCLITYIDFDIIPIPTTSSIGSINREPYDVRLVNCKGMFDPQMVMVYFNRFKGMLLSQILPSLITRPDDYGLNVSIQLDLFSKTQLFISLGGGTPIELTYPSFCDGMLTPTVIRGSEGTNTLASDAEFIYDNLISSSNVGTQTHIRRFY